MIDHYVSDWVSSKGIIAIGRIHRPATESHVTNDDVMRLKLDSITSDANTIPWSRAASDRNIGRANSYSVLELDDARDIKDNGSRPGCFACLAKTSYSVIVQIRNDNHSPHSTAK